MLEPRTDEKRLPVAGIPGRSPLCVPDMTHSITAHWLAANRLVNPYLKSGTAAKAPSNTQSSTKRARTLSGSSDELLDDQALAQSSNIRSNSEVAMTLLSGRS